MTTLKAEPDPPCAGDTLTICVEGGSGKSAVVTLSNGGGLTDEITIALDENGEGCSDWTIPDGWLGVNINTPGADELSLIVDPDC